MPIPNKIKFVRLLIKLVVEVLKANRTTREAGLHGKTIAPKKNPNMNALKKGLFFIGVLNLGNISPIS